MLQLAKVGSNPVQGSGKTFVVGHSSGGRDWAPTIHFWEEKAINKKTEGIGGHARKSRNHSPQIAGCEDGANGTQPLGAVRTGRKEPSEESVEANHLEERARGGLSSTSAGLKNIPVT